MVGISGKKFFIVEKYKNIEKNVEKSLKIRLKTKLFIKIFGLYYNNKLAKINL